jgi:phosphoribosylaminoimidazole-succinocarboxamide synthase
MTGKLLYEGKAKQVFDTENPGEVLVLYKDDATAFNGQKKGQIDSKGLLNNAISTHFFEMLEKAGVKTHFIKKIDDRSMLVKKVAIILIEVVIRNISAGSLSQRLGWPEGKVIKSPIVEFYYKDDALGDPLINNYHIAALEVATPAELDFLASQGLKINSLLLEHLKDRKVKLVDFKLEFGRLPNGEIILADEISPDTCRFWDSETNEKLDKDRFRRDLGKVEEAYQEIHRRLVG